MALGIYRLVSVGVYEKHSEDGDASNPVTTKHHGRNGDTYELKRYVRADDDHTYTNIEVKAEMVSGDDDIGAGSDPAASGWGVKLLLDVGSDPTESDWDVVNYGDPIDIVADDDQIGPSKSDLYIPFWYRIESPPGEDIETKTNIGLYVYYTDTP